MGVGWKRMRFRNEVWNKQQEVCREGYNTHARDPCSSRRSGTKNEGKRDYRTPNPAISMNLVVLFIAMVVILGVSWRKAELSSSSMTSACSATSACRSQNIFPSAS